MQAATALPRNLPRPPHALPAGALERAPGGARITVAGLVLLRQRPGTAKGVIFVTLEDETGTVNVVVWKNVFQKFRRAVIAGRLLRITGRIQREGGVTHVIADTVEDISDMLNDLLAGQEASRPGLCATPRNSVASGKQTGGRPGSEARYRCRSERFP